MDWVMVFVIGDKQRCTSQNSGAVADDAIVDPGCRETGTEENVENWMTDLAD